MSPPFSQLESPRAGLKAYLGFLPGSIYLVADSCGRWFGDNHLAAEAWANAQNVMGHDVFFVANVVRPGCRGMPWPADIEAVRFCLIDVTPPFYADEGAQQALGLTPPSLTIWSGDVWQLLWAVTSTSAEESEQVSRGLAHAFGGNTVCTNVDRPFRVPGTINCQTGERTLLLRQRAVAYSASMLLERFPYPERT